MYIYSLIIDPTIVGNLRVVPVDHTPVSAYSLFREFKNPHYVPLGTTTCNINIHTFVFSDAGEI